MQPKQEHITDPNTPIRLSTKYDAADLELCLVAVRSAITELTRGSLSKALTGSVVLDSDDLRLRDMPIVTFTALEHRASWMLHNAASQPADKDLAQDVALTAVMLKWQALGRTIRGTMAPEQDIINLFTKFKVSLEAALGAGHT